MLKKLGCFLKFFIAFQVRESNSLKERKSPASKMIKKKYSAKMPFIQWPSFTRFYSNFIYYLYTDGGKFEEKRSSTILGKWFHAKPQVMSAYMQNKVSKNIRIASVLKCYRLTASNSFDVGMLFCWNLRNTEFVFEYVWKIFWAISTSLICSVKVPTRLTLTCFKSCITDESYITPPQGMNIGSWGLKKS